MGKGAIYDEDEFGLDEKEPCGPEMEDEEDEEDEEGRDEYEKDGFIVDDVEEEDEQDIEEERQKRKKRKKKEEYVLDEEDYKLLEDNNISIQQPKGSKKFKRLKKARREIGGSSSDVEDFVETGKGGWTAEEKLKRSLFGDDEAPLEDIGEEVKPEEEEDGDIGDEDEMADFIVDEEVDEDGAPLRRRKVKKKRFRQAPGISSSALQEAHEIFGDVDDLLQLCKKELDADEWRERRLEDEFEPIIISEKYMTEKDDHIREIDIPERLQISEEGTGPPLLDEISLEDEASWIYCQLGNGASILFGTTNVQDLSINREDILQFLDLVHVQKLDIPFIAMYRKEEISSLLKDPEQEAEDNLDKGEKAPTVRWHKVLWAIQNLDRKWLLLQKRKTALQSYYKKRFDEELCHVYDETRLSLNHQLFESAMKSLKAAESEREVDDVDSKFNLHFPPGEIGADEGQFKRPTRKSLYGICSKSGLWEVAGKFGYSSEQFGLQLSLVKMRNDELEDRKETPEEMASNFTCAVFETPQAVLKGARHMVATEISCEPCVRKHVRSYFMDHIVISTSPTPEGNVAIDPFHQFAAVKWLREKPLSRFQDAQWLLIQKAEEENFLNVNIKLPEKHLKKLIDDCNEYYLSDGVSKSAQLWNEQRKLILQDAIVGFLLPSMEKEARSLMTSRAKNWLLMEYGKTFWNKVSVGPYWHKENDISYNDEAAPRVMACCWGTGKQATTFVMLDSSGEVLDILYTGSLTLRSQNVNDQQRKKNDQERVLKFMRDHQPHVVVLGAVNLSCTRLKDDIYEIMFKMAEENPRDVGHAMDGLSIVYGDESLPCLYENSHISSAQLQGQIGIVKRAVALGRYLQNPLAMIATLCGPGKEILSWKLNSLQNFLTPDEKYEMVEQVMVDVTNQVGLDTNLAISHEWLFSPLQFVSGLGPRKAASLQRSLVRVGAIFTRKDFMTAHGLGKKVFFNVVGFLRIRRSGLAASSSQFIDLLDDSRIHPESYTLTQELAKDVFDEDVKGDVNDEEDTQETAIEHVRDKPHLLKALDVNEYAKSRKWENKIATLLGIKRELMHGFKDPRKQYEEPSQDEEFYMISGENEDTLAEGRVVQATVRRLQAHRAICMLESGLTAMLMKEDYADNSTDIAELFERLHEGDVLTCKIKSIQKNRYQVFLVCRESELRSNHYQIARSLDPYYHEDCSRLQSEQERVRKEKEFAKKHFKPRMIVHRCFQNITADEATEFLSDKDPGESIIRPSSRGPSFLTLTLKVYDGVFAHKDIVEGGKELKDITSLLRIGKTLKIGEDTFEDLDEVMACYIDPLVARLKSMLIYRKFKRGTKIEIDELMKIEKLKYPMRIVYGFGISHEHPGTFILTYIRNTNPRHEYIGLYPKGFKFRRIMFEDIDLLLAYFQRHIDDSLHDSTPSIRSVAAMVPMRSPATGGTSAASTGGLGGVSGDDGSWRGQFSDRDQASKRGSRAGRGHPSGVPKPYGGGVRGCGRGRGCGHGRGSYNNSRENNTNDESQETDYDAPRWHSTTKHGDEGNFPGAKIQNSPGRKAFPGGWGSNGSSGNGGNGWGNDGGSNWGGTNRSAKGKWGGSSESSGNGGGDNWGGADGSSKKKSSSPGGRSDNGGNGWGSGGGGNWGSGGNGGNGWGNGSSNNCGGIDGSAGGNWGGSSWSSGNGGGGNWGGVDGSSKGNSGGSCGDSGNGWGDGGDSDWGGSGGSNVNGGSNNWVGSVESTGNRGNGGGDGSGSNWGVTDKRSNGNSGGFHGICGNNGGNSVGSDGGRNWRGTDGSSKGNWGGSGGNSWGHGGGSNWGGTEGSCKGN